MLDFLSDGSGSNPDSRIDMEKEENRFVKSGRKGGLNSIIHLKEWHEHCVKQYMKSPKICNRCNEIIPYEKRRNKYCSKRCAALSNNKLFPRTHNGVPFPNCKKCGKKLKHHGNFCKECKGLMHEEKIINCGDFGHPVLSTVRRYLIKIRGYKCEQCKNSIWDGKPIPLDTHHINGNSGDNRLENLKLLCPNCHSLTDNFKSKNKGNGKRKRKSWG